MDCFSVWLSAALLLTTVLTLLKFLCWATKAHQILEENNSLPTIQITNRVPQKLLKLLNKYLLMVTFENGKHYLILFEISNNGANIGFEVRKDYSHSTTC